MYKTYFFNTFLLGRPKPRKKMRLMENYRQLEEGKGKGVYTKEKKRQEGKEKNREIRRKNPGRGKGHNELERGKGEKMGR